MECRKQEAESGETGWKGATGPTRIFHVPAFPTSRDSRFSRVSRAISSAAGMHLQVRILPELLDLDQPLFPDPGLLQCLAFLRAAVLAALPDRPVQRPDRVG